MVGALTMMSPEEKKEKLRHCGLIAVRKVKSSLTGIMRKLAKLALFGILFLAWLNVAVFISHGSPWASLSGIWPLAMIFSVFGTFVTIIWGYLDYLRQFCGRQGFDTDKALKRCLEFILTVLAIFGPLFVVVLIIARFNYPDTLDAFETLPYAVLIVYLAVIGVSLDLSIGVSELHKRWVDRKNNVLGIAEAKCIEGIGYLFCKADWCN
jgi:hypothetical protein